MNRKVWIGNDVKQEAPMKPPLFLYSNSTRKLASFTTELIWPEILICRVVTMEEFFAYFFGINIKFGYRNPPILTQCGLVNIATYTE